MSELAARERIILAIDTSETQEAERLARTAQEAGARFVKLGLELSTATSWSYCSELAAEYGLDWVADAKLDDIPNTVQKSVANIGSLKHRPYGITMHATSGEESMRLAQKEAGKIKMLGVTILTSIKPEEAAELYRAHVAPDDIATLFERLFGPDAPDEQDRQLQQEVIDTYFEDRAEEVVKEKVLELAHAAASVGLKGIVCSPREVGMIKRDPKTKGLFSMIPGTRSLTADKQDQSRTATPAAAILDGADLLVIGRQITQAPDPAGAYEAVVAEIMGVTK